MTAAIFFFSLTLQNNPYPHFPFLNPKLLPKNPKPIRFWNQTNTYLSLNSTPDQNNPDSSSPLSHPSSSSNVAIKMPTPPWMKGPLLLQPHELINLSKPQFKKTLQSEKGKNDKLVGIRGEQATQRIVKSIEKLRKDYQNSEASEMGKEVFEFERCLEGFESEHGGFRVRERKPWEREERVVFRRVKKEKKQSVAELRLDKELLERLRGEAMKMRQWVKVKKAGVNQVVVDQIKFIWRRNELAMVKFDVPLCRNMDRAEEILEIKTGGLVVWNKDDTLVVFRGCNHPFTLKNSPKKLLGFSVNSQEGLYRRSMNGKIRKFGEGEIKLKEDLNLEKVRGSLYERETDRLLDGLGPRFIDWWMNKPLPVDGDLLPEKVNGFKPPFRQCLPNTRPQLTDSELTYLRKLAHPLPTHFVLGRNRRLQGLAAAILKLWEKSLIAKIALKMGTPNTDNEQMAYELKCLTGGVVLLRNKYIIILYRGKDFIPGEVATLIAEREVELTKCQLYEEDSRHKTSEIVSLNDRPVEEDKSTVGTLSDFKEIQKEFGKLKKENIEAKIRIEAEKERLEKEIKQHEHRLNILNFKINKSSKDLSKLNALWTPSEPDTDREIITDEERECFRKIGQKMDAFLILGRRGIFDGVIEGLRQHWKHREVVKVITMQRSFRQVMYTSKLLEVASGGILVSIEKLKQGHAIIIYRGKNYKRPVKPKVKNLLTKRKALQRSLELQRVGSLKYFSNQRQQAILELKQKLDNLVENSEKNSLD